MRINTNVSSITAQEAAINTNNSIQKSLEKLSSGLKINKASDDASGLAIADKLRTQATSINQGVSNGNSAVTLLQIADKSMAEQSNILDTVKAKLIQANTDTTSAEGRESIRKDIGKLLEQLDNIAEQTNYNGNVLLQSASNSTDQSAALNFQIGESEADIIGNTAIQSNTVGLADQTLGLDSDATLGELASGGGSQIITNTGSDTITITEDGQTNGIESQLSGQLGQITAATNAVVISGASSAENVLLNSFAEAGDLTKNTNGTFTLAASASIDFENTSVNSITLTQATGGTIDIDNTLVDADSNTINATFSIENTGTSSGTGGNIVLTADADDEVAIGLSLNTLGNLDSGNLTSEMADVFQDVVDKSISTLNGYRGDIGSTQNQVESAVRNLMTQSTNVQAAESIIRDVDYAAESANFNKQNIISQAGSYAISQANSVQQNVLRLLQ